MDQATTANRPTPRTRRLVSLLIVLHFLAILTAVTSASNRGFPAPALAVLANQPCQPYLQLTFLSNAYRFYSPEPGTPGLLWFRIQYEDQTVRWLELPRRQGTSLGMHYLRCQALANHPLQHLNPCPDSPGRLQFDELGEIGMASYVRHIAATLQGTRADGSPLPVRSVGIYSLQHAAREPAQIRAGWEANDLRTYRAAFLGAFNAAGERTDEHRPYAVEQPTAFVAAGIVAVDVWPHLRGHEGSDRLHRLDELELPQPIRRLLDRFPELRGPVVKPADLEKHIERLLADATVRD